uniref:WWE domain-containing protein n=1 Tax=Steinernema glaseri TaxID=37863 RepID=A0A1I8ALP7_9BILA
MQRKEEVCVKGSKACNRRTFCRGQLQSSSRDCSMLHIRAQISNLILSTVISKSKRPPSAEPLLIFRPQLSTSTPLSTQKVQAMWLTKLTVPDEIKEAIAFTVKDGWLYYFDSEGELRMYNLTTGEEEQLQIEGCEGSPREIFCVNGRINVQFRHYGHNNFVELEFDATEPGVASVESGVEVHLSSSSAVQVGDRVFCLENYRLYEGIGKCSGVSPSNLARSTLQSFHLERPDVLRDQGGRSVLLEFLSSGRREPSADKETTEAT